MLEALLEFAKSTGFYGLTVGSIIMLGVSCLLIPQVSPFPRANFSLLNDTPNRVAPKIL